jgi:hypothetical protein
MPNEFVARNGFISNNNSVITGSLTVTGGLTGSILSASYSVTASYSLNTATASFVISAITASRALNAATASYALTASAALDTSYDASQVTNTNFGYITPNLVMSEVTGAYTSIPGLDNIIVTPFLVYADCILTGSGLTYGSTGSGVLAIAKMGLYEDSGNMLPGRLIQDFGQVTTTSTTLGYTPLTPNPQVRLKAKTVYWTAVVGDAGIKLPVPFLVNGMYNPIMQVQLVPPASPLAPNVTYHRNIFSYGYVSGGAVANGLPTTMPSTAASYTVNSYFTSSGYIGPVLSVVYG